VKEDGHADWISRWIAIMIHSTLVTNFLLSPLSHFLFLASLHCGDGLAVDMGVWEVSQGRYPFWGGFWEATPSREMCFFLTLEVCLVFRFIKVGSESFGIVSGSE